MKLGKLLLTLCLCAGIWPVAAEGVYTRVVDDEAKVESCRRWMESGVWRNGFGAASPHSSVNAVDFYEQYSKNKVQWDAVFGWLRDNDLLAVPAGKQAIDGTTVTVSVEDSSNRPFGKSRSESHRQKIDLQYCVKGIERFGILDHESSAPNCEYRPDVIHYDYDPEKVRLFDSSPDSFFIFFPEDWHIAKIANDTDDQEIRVIVFKIDYVE